MISKAFANTRKTIISGETQRYFAAVMTTPNKSLQNSERKSKSVQKREFKSSPKLCDAAIGSMNTLTEGTNVWLPKTCGFIGGGNMADALL